MRRMIGSEVALPCPHGHGVGHLAVDGDRIADPAGHRRFHAIAEARRDLRLPAQPPILDHPDQLPVNLRRLGFLDDQCVGEAAAHLHQTVSVRMDQNVPAHGSTPMTKISGTGH